MTHPTNCPYCGSPALSEVAYSDSLKFGRRRLLINGLLKHSCADCGMEVVDAAQQNHNLSVTNEVVSHSGLITPGMLKQFREKWDLTQRDASLMFRAGESAFAKWESGQVNMSGPAALLVECADIFYGMVEYLAGKVDVKVRPPVRPSRSFSMHHSTQACNEELYSAVAESVEIVLQAPSRHNDWSYAPKQALLKTGSSGNRAWAAVPL